MNTIRLILPHAICAALVSTAAAQSFPVTPTTPQSFKFKPTGQTANAEATVSPAKVPAVKQISYLTLGPVRQWKSADGNSRIGQLIAWEQTEVTIAITDKTKGNAAPVPPAVKGRPTLIREGKIRLLIERKPYEIPLDRLGADERKYVADFEASLAAKS